MAKPEEGAFKPYDIRFIYKKGFSEDLAYRIGRGFVDFVGCKNVVIGRDARKSSGPLFEAISRGIMDQGADVIEIGLCSTPMLYFAVANYGYDAGIMITASHNPAEYNGFKLTREQAIPIGQDNGMLDIKAKVLSKGFSKPTREGKLIRRDIMQDYCVHVLSKISVIDRMKIVVDAGNAMAGYTLPKIFESLPVEVVPMYFKLDLSFPNHEANPLKFETLKSLQARVVEEKAQLGVAFDGDADRVFFVDEQGSIVPADFTTALLAEEMLKKHPGSVVLYDLRSSWVVREVIERHGGKPMMCRVGHAFIKQQMRANDAVFGGELSGHFYFKDNFYTESGVITMLRMMELMCRRRGKLSELVAPLKRYHQSGEINFRVSDREAVLAAIEKHFSGEKISHLDGVKIETNEYWVNIRPSNTEPLVRLTAEAKHPETLKRVVDEVKRVVEPFLVKEN